MYSFCRCMMVLTLSTIRSAWYSEQKFAKETTMDFRWYLLHQNVVPKSEDKTYGDQKTILTADYEVPSAITEVTKDLLVFRKTGNFVNPSRYARCECVASGGDRVGVGYFDEDGLHVDYCWDDDRSYGIGAFDAPQYKEVIFNDKNCFSFHN